MICENISVNRDGHLTFTGRDTVALAKQYGTPLYLFDETRFRTLCRTYKQAMKEAFGENALPLYAGKALCFSYLYKVLREEGLGIDVVSGGELFTALRAGFPASLAVFHGNNKTDEEIAYGIKEGVGRFVCDNTDELKRIEAEASRQNKIQKVLLRLTVGIDPHTHHAITTGTVDSKFGAAIETGDAEKLVRQALSSRHIELCGFHSHIGSQIFSASPFCMAARKLCEFAAFVKANYGYTVQELNLGGGMAARYTLRDPEPDYAHMIGEVGKTVNEALADAGLPPLRIFMEPGRSLVASAGMTLYEIGAVKEITGVKNYVSVNGGMTDNPRYALYEAPYTLLSANKVSEEADYRCTVAGRCCESGDVIQENVMLPHPAQGDILAVLTTGAYNYSMASHYNRVPKPALVVLTDKDDFVAVRRETYEDLVSCDIL